MRFWVMVFPISIASATNEPCIFEISFFLFFFARRVGKGNLKRPSKLGRKIPNRKCSESRHAWLRVKVPSWPACHSAGNEICAFPHPAEEGVPLSRSCLKKYMQPKTKYYELLIPWEVDKWHLRCLIEWYTSAPILPSCKSVSWQKNGVPASAGLNR